ncbi:uncharacterized protein JCM15063_001721 [Sporobolomyces koalae]|uniref:uncharacterized protein n=1 Tax=Sporobolomyces koalae TaxID=500713 RepID=UPI0031716386
MLQDTTNHPTSTGPAPFEVDPCAPSAPPCLPRSTSIASAHSLSLSKRPSTPANASLVSMSWREEEAILKHQLRAAKAEIQQLQAKLGIKNNAAPFNSSSPRKPPPLPASAPASSPELLHSLTPERKLSATATDPSPTRTSRKVSTTSIESATSASPAPAAIPTPAAAAPASTSPSRIPQPTATAYAPVGPVALNRALLSNERPPKSPTALPVPSPPSALPSISTSDTPTASTSAPAPIEIEDIDRSLSPPPILLAARQSRLSDPGYVSSMHSSRYSGGGGGGGGSTSRPENPFFSSGNPARERLSKSVTSAQSGSGKVISGLQSDLLLARTGLESTRGQLRLSQRAVDFLGRQNEDLKETKERLNNEIEQLTRQLNRRERTGEETLGRARTAEQALTALRDEHKNYVSTHKSRTKELEESEKKAREEQKRVEVEYSSLRESFKSMSIGWKQDLDWLKETLRNNEKRLQEKSQALEKLIDSKNQLAASLTETVGSISRANEEFTSRYSTSASSALESLDALTLAHAEDRQRVDAVGSEMKRLKQNIANADAQTS